MKQVYLLQAKSKYDDDYENIGAYSSMEKAEIKKEKLINYEGFSYYQDCDWYIETIVFDDI